jgi:hypothetical protein
MERIEEKLPGFASAFKKASAKRLTDLQWSALDRRLVMAAFEHIASISRRDPEKEPAPSTKS